MGLAQLDFSPHSDGESKKSKGKNAIEKVDNTLTQELFIAICSPIGSLKETVIERLLNFVKINYGYDVEHIKLSNYIEEIDIDYEDTSSSAKSIIFNQYFNKIAKGNHIRDTFHNSHLAEKAVESIYLSRLAEVKAKRPEIEEGDINPEHFESRRKLFLVDSIKSKEELELFRKVYTDNFYQISLFSSLEERRKNLARKGFTKPEIEEIIDIDDKQNFNHGQNVRGTFVEGDFFMRVSAGNTPEIERKIQRFFNLIFESSIVTPTIEEKSMYLAKSASGNSACLSRQVGASIIDKKGTLLATGWNDVPKFGGNLYTSDYVRDHRCFNLGYCSNDKHKDELVENIIKSLLNDNDTRQMLEKDNVVDLDLVKKIRNNLRNSKVKDIIEYSRSIHAEMHAIIQGSQLTGDKMVNGVLFCTTYPCHNCARHIVAAGIKEVYYVEPYVKSLCLTLHDDSMTENEHEVEKVKILMFDGVAPRNYLTFFTNFAERKQNGNVIPKILKNLSPKKAKSLQALSTLEQQALHSLGQQTKHSLSKN
ncbi:deoxycytidylate deaminase [Taibaiella sp. KBW10]|uniref:anti-phage dCTP deaminase n=1 Tax=Taibaiella sp. KBW10 TaxID=2153357 RepID=UPI000F5B4FD5|nr:anti-phage dCTP deaminase [Taibaiella sp. KBW10]RQO32647.1 deoxycytidylate deaminase [Taibaiella sp. KBW10]